MARCTLVGSPSGRTGSRSGRPSPRTRSTASPIPWLVGILSPSLASDLVSIAHLALAACGTALFASRLGAGPLGRIVPGALYALGGHVTTVVPNGMVIAIAWLPWIACAAERLARCEAQQLRVVVARGAVVAAAFALQATMAGEPAHLLTASLLAVVVTLARADRPLRAVMRLVVSLVAALPLSAVVLLPARSLRAWSDRATDLPSLYHAV